MSFDGDHVLILVVAFIKLSQNGDLKFSGTGASHILSDRGWDPRPPIHPPYELIVGLVEYGEFCFPKFGLTLKVIHSGVHLCYGAFFIV